MEKRDKQIMVFDRNLLFEDDYFEGFKPKEEVDFESRILKNCQFIARGEVEKNHEYKQPIGYALVINPTSKQVLVFQRASEDSEYTEKRLQGKWSWGLGGHIERMDTRTRNPLYASLLREVQEEVELNIISTPRILGYINCDSDDVGKVHFGVLYVVETDSEILKPKDSEIERCELKTLEELERICFSPSHDVEEWSRISFEPLKMHLKN